MLKLPSLKRVGRMASGQSVKDLDKFLDDLPGNVGYAALTVAISAWIFAAAAVFFAAQEWSHVTELKAELVAAEALTPPVPTLEYQKVGREELQTFVKKIERYYPQSIKLEAPENGRVVINGRNIREDYPEFRAAVGHVRQGNPLWQVNVGEMCVGRDCPKVPFQIVLDVQKVSVSQP